MVARVQAGAGRPDRRLVAALRVICRGTAGADHAGDGPPAAGRRDHASPVMSGRITAARPVRVELGGCYAEPHTTGPRFTEMPVTVHKVQAGSHVIKSVLTSGLEPLKNSLFRSRPAENALFCWLFCIGQAALWRISAFSLRNASRPVFIGPGAF